MTVIEAVILGIAQGLTEFLPVSSSGHLVLLHDAFGLEKGGLAFDVALHIGTLLALVIFFHNDLIRLFKSLIRQDSDTHLARMVALATVPAVIAGVLLQSAAESSFRSSRLVALNLMLFGIIMLLAERYAARKRRQSSLQQTTRNQALAVGLAQAAAIIPGISRSGSTITAGLFAGLDRVAATRFSFLLAMPITLGAILKVLLDDSTIQRVDNGPALLIVGIAASFVSGLAAIRFLLKFLAKHSLATFAYYRLAVGALVLAILALN